MKTSEFIDNLAAGNAAAAKEAWMIKASIAANLANTDDGKMKIELHTIQENCIQMAGKFRSFAIL